MKTGQEMFAWNFIETALRVPRIKEQLPEYAVAISTFTNTYEIELRRLWSEFKDSPTLENGKLLSDRIQQYAANLWPEALAEILGIDLDELTEKQKTLLEDSLKTHYGFIEGSLLPDILSVFESDSGVLDGDSFNKFDHRLIFMYAGALWSLGFLATVMFDGLSVRDLADLFIFAGPNDAVTCQGDRGCDQFANRIFSVADILARDIIPGHLACLTNCRHMLLPVASPLGKEVQQREKGSSKSGNFGHGGRPGQVGGSDPAMTSPGNAFIAGRTVQEWFDQQKHLSEDWAKEVLEDFDALDTPTEVTRDLLKDYLNRLGKHRELILDEGIQILLERKPGTLRSPDEAKKFMSRLMMHDEDKYEFDIAESYVGSFKIDKKLYEGAFTVAMTAHHQANDHHLEFWVEKGRAAQMKPQAFWEMMADWRGTARERGMVPYAYYDKYGRKMKLHPLTREAVEYELDKLR